MSSHLGSRRPSMWDVTGEDVEVNGVSSGMVDSSGVD